MTALIKKLLGKYNDILLRKPLPTSMVTAGGIAIVGDYFTQTFIEKHEKSTENSQELEWYVPNLERSLKMAIMGVFWSGPIGLAFY